MVEHNANQVMAIMVNSTQAHRLLAAAIQAAKRTEFKAARQKIAAADQALAKARQAQTALLTKEAQGHPVHLTLLLIHAQDHLMSTTAYCETTKEIVALYQKLTLVTSEKKG